MLTARLGWRAASPGTLTRPRTSGALGNASAPMRPVKPPTPTNVGRGSLAELSSRTTTASWAFFPTGTAMTSPRRSRRSTVTVSVWRSSMLRRLAAFSSAEIVERSSRYASSPSTSPPASPISAFSCATRARARSSSATSPTTSPSAWNWAKDFSIIFRASA